MIVEDVAQADKSGQRYFIKVLDNRPDGSSYREDFVIKVPEDRVVPVENAQRQVQLKKTGEWVDRIYVDRNGEQQIRPIGELETMLRIVNHRQYIKRIVQRHMNRARRANKTGDNTGSEILNRFTKDRTKIGNMQERLQADTWELQEVRLDDTRRNI